MQRASRRLLCCVCLPEEKRDALQGQGQRREEGPARGHEEKEAIQITVEGLGLVNPGFSLSGEDSPDQRSSMARSTSSVSACQRAMKKRRLKPLSSLPIQARVEQATGPCSGEGDEEDEEEEPLMFDSAADCIDFSGSFLTPPVINLIPPTPSDIVDDDDQFFDMNSEEESVAHTSGSDGSVATGDQESYEERTESMESEEPKKEAHSQADDDTNTEPEGNQGLKAEEEKGANQAKAEKEKPKTGFLRSAYQVAPLPGYPSKRSFNAGINLLQFTEHNLDDLNNKDVSCSELLKAELHLLPLTTKMETFVRLRKPASRSCSLGETVTRSLTFHVITQTTDLLHEEEGLPRQRRITVASYMPQSKDQNGNFPGKDVGRQEAKSLGELNTDEVCQWFSSIGLQKCLPFIREAELCGADIAAVDVNTLEILHICTLAEREQLLSAIYKQLHPPSSITQKLEDLLETFGPNNVERFTAALVSMSKSRSSLCLNTTRSSLKLRSKNYMVQRNSQLIEITINASEQIVHLRTPKETTVAKVIESCIKMLGMTESKDIFTLKDKQEPLEEFTQERQVGTLLTPGNRQLELHLCKREQPKGLNAYHLPNVGSSPENGAASHNIQGNQPAKEKIKELSQKVDSLQNVILQVQELHHGLVAFCTELKRLDVEEDVTGLGSTELEQRLELLQGQLKDKRQSLQNLKENISNAAAHGKKRVEFHLVDKMKLNCQVFKEEISLVHLRRQVAYLQKALQDCYEQERVQRKGLPTGSLSQLVSPQCPAILLVVQESLGPDGRYAFTCHSQEGGGLVVVQVENTHLCLDDRLVEVNGVPVLNATEEELAGLLLQGPSAQIVVLRRPPTGPILQHPLLPNRMVHTESPLTEAPERVAVTMETPPQCKLIAI